MLGQNFHVFERNGLFLAQLVFISHFLVQIRDRDSDVNWPMCKISAKLDKRQRSSNLHLEQYQNCLMMSCTRDSDDVIKFFMLLRDFVPEYHHTKFGDNWKTNKGET